MNVQLFPRVWILKISRKAFRIPLSVPGSRLKAVLDIRIRLQTHYPSGYPDGKPDSDQLWSLSETQVAWVTFWDSDSAPVPKFLNRVRIRVRQFFKFENLTPVQTPATIIDPTEIYPCLYLRNDHTDSCYCWNGQVTLCPFFSQIFDSGTGSGPKEKRRILAESTPVIRIRSHLWLEDIVLDFGGTIGLWVSIVLWGVVPLVLW